MWNGNTGRSACTDCNAGKYSITTGASTSDKCLACPRGSFSSAGSDRCVECDAGKYAGGSSAATSDDACSDCSVGKWSSKGAIECTDCDIGKSTDSKGASSPSECEPCPVGTFMPSGSTACQVCQSGRYNDKANMAVIECEDCPAGTYNNDAGTNANRHDQESDCSACPTGKYQDDNGSTECKLCPSGTFAAAGTSGFKSFSECAVCGSGKYSETSNNGLSCTNCPSGKFLEDNGSDKNLHSSSSKCTACFAGSYNSQPGQASCDLCGQGEYQASTGQIACKNCPKGTWNDNSVGPTVRMSHNELTDCVVCEEGKYSNFEKNGDDCIDCVAGKYNKDLSSNPQASDHDNILDCQACPGGTFSGVAATHCDLCNEGKYSTTSGVSEASCQPCEKGTYNQIKGQQSCSICGPGEYTSSTQSTSCSACPTGRYLTDDRTSRFEHDASGDCTLCAAGAYNPYERSQRCFDCGIGKSSLGGASTCTDCVPGTFANAAGSSSCTACPDGSFSSDAGSSDCVPCTRGYYSKEIKTQCLPCTAGKFANTGDSEIGSSSCQNCAAGKYASGDSAADKCNDCTPGKTSGSGTAAECPDCPLNHFSSTTRAVVCDRCPSGQNAVVGSSSCSTCSGVIISSGCIECVAGEFASVATCEPCFAGTYSPGGASDRCTPCAAGKFSSTDSTECTERCTECASCPSGKFSTPGSSSCLACPAGTYSAVGTPNGCNACAAGSFSEAEADNCSPCEAGTYASDGAPQCSSCPGGKYSGSSAQTCVECAKGKFSGAKANTCENCNVGKYADNVGMGSCLNCEPGTFASSGGSEACTNCEAGKISAVNRVDCKDCPAGQSTDGQEGQYLCTNCVPGSYSEPSAASCAQCSPGTYSGNGAEACDECDEGYYCNEGSTSQRQNVCGANFDGSTAEKAEKLKASVYCPTGTGVPVDVGVGYFTTPTYVESDIRVNRDHCTDGFFCEYGIALPFTQWTKCNQTITIDEAPHATADALHFVFKFLAEKNSAIENPDLRVKVTEDEDGNLLVGYTFIEAINFEPDDPVTDGEERPSCITADGFSFDGDTLKYDRALNFNDCKAGFQIKVKANVQFNGCEAGFDAAFGVCENQETEVCTSTVVVKNVNDPPVFQDSQDKGEDLPCYFRTSYQFEIEEQSPEFTKVGTFGLEECVIDEDPADSVTFSIKEEDGGSGANLFGVNPCGGQIFVKEDVDLRYVFNAVNDNQYTLNIVVTDTFGATDEEVVTIQLLNINDPPTFNTNLPTEYTVDENQIVGIQIEPVTEIASDLDKGSAQLAVLEFSLLQNEDDAFTIDSGNGRLTSNIEFNAEKKDAYYIKIQVTDNQEGTIPAKTGLIKVAVQNLNDSPEVRTRFENKVRGC